MRTILASLIVACVLFNGSLSAAEWWVDNLAIDGRPWDGTTKDTPFLSIQDAADVVGLGDVVYVKATTLPYEPFQMVTSGTANDVIEFIGYGSSPNDLEGGTGVPDSYSEIDVLNEGEPKSTVSDSPRIHGDVDDDGDYEELGIDFEGKSYISVRNFWVEKANVGIYVNGSNCEVKNAYVWNCDEDRTAYDGRGILIGNGASNCIIDCTVYNGGQQGFTIKDSSDNMILDSRCYSDDNDLYDANPDPQVEDWKNYVFTHYFFLIDNGDDNEINNCNAERHEDPQGGWTTRHAGHGFVVQANTSNSKDAQRNDFIDCYAQDIKDAYLLKGRISNNKFLSCDSTITTSGEGTSVGNELGRIRMYAGPKDNYFNGMFFVNSDVAVDFEGHGSWDENANTDEISAERNDFENCIFECENAIVFCADSDEVGDLDDGTVQKVKHNNFSNCNFIGDASPSGQATNVFFKSFRESANNYMQNCIIHRFDEFQKEHNSTYDMTTNGGCYFDYCAFDNNAGHDFPDVDLLDLFFSGSNLDENDGSVDVDYIIYELEHTSMCIDAGRDLGAGADQTDFDGHSRGSTWDIGAQEF